MIGRRGERREVADEEIRDPTIFSGFDQKRGKHSHRTNIILTPTQGNPDLRIYFRFTLSTSSQHQRWLELAKERSINLRKQMCEGDVAIPIWNVFLYRFILFHKLMKSQRQTGTGTGSAPRGGGNLSWPLQVIMMIMMIVMIITFIMMTPGLFN